MAPMKLEIVTVERLVYSEDVDVLVAPGIEGELGILPRHAPLLTVLQPGEIRVSKDGNETYMSVSGGFIEVMSNTVTILADTAERVEDIDAERAEAAFKRAQERISSAVSEMDLQRAMASLKRSQARIGVVTRRRRQQRGERPTQQPPTQ